MLIFSYCVIVGRHDARVDIFFEDGTTSCFIVFSKQDIEREKASGYNLCTRELGQ